MQRLLQFAVTRAGPGAPCSAEKYAATIVQCHRSFQQTGRAVMRGKGGAVYRTAWRVQREEALRNWLHRRARQCRWLSDDGAEWELLSHTQHYNAAHHVLRLLAGGAHGGARHRRDAMRAAHPHLCIICGSDQIKLSWRSPHPEKAGLAWCRDCDPFEGHAPARTLLTGLGMAEAEMGRRERRPDPAVILAATVSNPDGAEYDWGSSPFGPCPLCGCGEASSEHILRWCPAVAAAWIQLQQDSGVLAEAIRGLEGNAQDVTALLHQAAYLNATLGGRAAVSWDKGSRLLTSAVKAYTRDYNGQDEVQEMEHALLGPGLLGVLPVWASLSHADCDPCQQRHVHLLCSRHSHGDKAEHPGYTGRWRPHLTCAVSNGSPVAAHRGEEALAAWPAEGRHWFPPPRPVEGAAANAVWHTERCHACGQHVRHLQALQDIQQHEEVTIPLGHSGNIGWAAEHPGTIITFNGGAREIQGQKVAAGAAIHWEHDQASAWIPSSTGTAALPYHADSQIAEAYGALMALRLLAAAAARHSRVRICGDNLGVVRYCAGTGRATRLQVARESRPSTGRSRGAWHGDHVGSRPPQTQHWCGACRYRRMRLRGWARCPGGG